MEARIRRSLPEGASGLLCRSLTFVLVRVVLAEQFADVRQWFLSIVGFAVSVDSTLALLSGIASNPDEHVKEGRR